jgi:hypothetical protein
MAPRGVSDVFDSPEHCEDYRDTYDTPPRAPEGRLTGPRAAGRPPLTPPGNRKLSDSRSGCRHRSDVADQLYQEAPHRIDQDRRYATYVQNGDTFTWGTPVSDVPTRHRLDGGAALLPGALAQCSKPQLCRHVTIQAYAYISPGPAVPALFFYGPQLTRKALSSPRRLPDPPRHRASRF